MEVPRNIESSVGNVLRKTAKFITRSLRGPSLEERIRKGKICVVESAEGVRFYGSSLPLPGLAEANMVDLTEKPAPTESADTVSKAE